MRGGHGNASRRGSIYIVVVATVMLVALLGTAGVLAQTRQRERARAAQDAPRAAALARAAVEIGLERIAEEPDWQDELGGGTWYDRVAPTGTPHDGTLSLHVTVIGSAGEVDGARPFVLTGEGRRGNAVRTIEVAFPIETTHEPLDCLEVALCAGNDLELKPYSAVLGEGTIYSQKSVKADTAMVDVDAEASDKTEGSVYRKGTRSRVGRRSQPDPDAIANAYKQLATTIRREDLPRSGGVYQLSGVALGPGHNPFGGGATNADGIYYLDLDAQEIVIENVRLVGTLILDEPDSNSVIRGSVSIAPAVEGYPSLIVRKEGLSFQLSSSDLTEPGAGVNFNPPGVPDGDGEEDADTADAYPSGIEGIVIAKKGVTFLPGGFASLRGHLISDDKITVEPTSVVRLEAWEEARLAPPPGFRASSESAITMGPWQRAMDP